jgi:hypothetical protein
MGVYGDWRPPDQREPRHPSLHRPSSAVEDVRHFHPAWPAATTPAVAPAYGPPPKLRLDGRSRLRSWRRSSRSRIRRRSRSGSSDPSPQAGGRLDAGSACSTLLRARGLAPRALEITPRWARVLERRAVTKRRPLGTPPGGEVDTPDNPSVCAQSVALADGSSIRGIPDIRASDRGQCYPRSASLVHRRSTFAANGWWTFARVA